MRNERSERSEKNCYPPPGNAQEGIYSQICYRDSEEALFERVVKDLVDDDTTLEHIC